jgi:hypothetical protein
MSKGDIPKEEKKTQKKLIAIIIAGVLALVAYLLSGRIWI